MGAVVQAHGAALSSPKVRSEDTTDKVFNNGVKNIASPCTWTKTAWRTFSKLSETALLS